MNVWARLYSVVETDADEADMKVTVSISAKIRIVIHGTEQAARDAVAKFGGLVVELNLSTLKGANEFPEISFCESDDNGSREPNRADSSASISIAGDAVPHTVTRSCIELHPDGDAFVDAVAKELGAYVELC